MPSDEAALRQANLETYSSVEYLIRNDLHLFEKHHPLLQVLYFDDHRPQVLVRVVPRVKDLF